MTSQFELLVSYYQIAISDTTLERPCNDWTREHVRQGFAWRPRSVSFGTIDSLLSEVSMRVAPAWEPTRESARTIRVPFTVVPSARLEVAVVADQRSIEIPSGEYAVTFEHGLCASGDKMWCRFTFVPDPAAEPAILVADQDLLNPPDPLVMTADPA